MRCAVAERPFYRDDALGLWVANGAAAVTAVLTRTLLGAPAGRAGAAGDRGIAGRRDLSTFGATTMGRGSARSSARRGATSTRRQPGRGAEPPFGRRGLPARPIRIELLAVARHREELLVLGALGADGGMDARFRGRHCAGRRRRRGGGREFRGGFPAGAVRPPCWELGRAARRAGTRQRRSDDPTPASSSPTESASLPGLRSDGGADRQHAPRPGRPPRFGRAGASRSRGWLTASGPGGPAPRSPVQNTRRFVGQPAVVAGQACKRGDAVGGPGRGQP